MVGPIAKHPATQQNPLSNPALVAAALAKRLASCLQAGPSGSGDSHSVAAADGGHEGGFTMCSWSGLVPRSLPSCRHCFAVLRVKSVHHAGQICSP